MVRVPAEPQPLLLSPPQIQTGPATASPLIVQVNQGPDVVAEVDSGHYAPWIGLTEATNMEVEPFRRAGDLPLPHPPPPTQSYSLQG